MHKLMNKKEEIKNRIDLINRGEVPEGYKCCWGYIYPESWNIKSLKDLFYKVKTKNTANESLPVLTNSATLGVILQDEYFDREIVNDENTNNYYIVENGDFMYNPRISSNAPAGPINRNTLGQKGIASPLYTIFRAKDTKNIEFVEKYFKSNYWHRYMKSVSNQGARHDRLNINDEDFMRMPIPQPSKQEQEKIAKILNYCDKVIELKEKLICEEIKKNINCGRKVLKKLKGDTVEIGEILDYEQPTKYIVKNQYKNKQNEEDIPILTANKAFIKSYTNEKFGIYDNLPVIIFDDFTVENKYVTFPFKVQSSAMKILKPKNPNINLLFVYKSMQLLKFKANDHKRYYLSEYQYMPINLPDIETQNRTVEILSKIDRKIELLQQELEQYKQLKKSLSQLLLTGIVRTVEADCEN